MIDDAVGDVKTTLLPLISEGRLSPGFTNKGSVISKSDTSLMLSEVSVAMIL